MEKNLPEILKRSEYAIQNLADLRQKNTVQRNSYISSRPRGRNSAIVLDTDSSVSNALNDFLQNFHDICVQLQDCVQSYILSASKIEDTSGFRKRTTAGSKRLSRSFSDNAIALEDVYELIGNGEALSRLTITTICESEAWLTKLVRHLKEKGTLPVSNLYRSGNLFIVLHKESRASIGSARSGLSRHLESRISVESPTNRRDEATAARQVQILQNQLRQERENIRNLETELDALRQTERPYGGLRNHTVSFLT